MASEWKETTLGEAAELLTGFPFKSNRYIDAADGIRLVRGDNVVQGKFRWDNVKRWPKNETGDIQEYFLRPEDVVLAMDRPWIEAGLKYASVQESDIPCLLVQRVSRLRAKKGFDQAFLRYIVGSRAFTDHVLSVQTGTAVPHISGSQIKEFRFICPPPPEQRAIAEVLRSLDDKIELNQRLNETLGALAQTVFKSWIMDATTDKMPKDWRVGKVSDLAALNRDSINPGEFPNESFDHYSIPAFDEGRTPKVETGDTIKSNKFIVPSDCLLVSKLNPRIPRIWLPTLRGRNRAICSTEFLVTTPKLGVSREFLFCLFTNETFVSVFETMVTGTSGSHQRVKPESLLGMDVVIPPPPMMRKFTETAAPLLQRINCNVAKSGTLAELRDTLLPKLLSGEIRVPFAAEQVKEAIG